MKIDMSDFEAKYGPHKAKSCEWPLSESGDLTASCGDTVLFKDTAYCDEHYHVAYRDPNGSMDTFDIELSKPGATSSSDEIPNIEED